jgi:hypothetical protein
LLAAEPDAERSGLDRRTEATPLFFWLERLGLPQYYSLLMEAGYDDIESMVDQMRSPLPLTESTFQSIGISKPGHVIRIVLKLEEDASLSHSMKLKGR